ncbi:MAG: 2,5-didehydrogluconate reductase [Hirschia sp.]|nr:2,5-didehydrogluconate reductase [Hirschia sp.]MBF19118.1 2,5-didehydrogluconate reductase [Hirschia sp.]|tara:strand:- start:1605 stop:2429 length:825 start_codon:yes stop_codon:yes gene_type:complete
MTLTTQHFGVEIPTVGFGTWQLEGAVAHHGVLEAIHAGYRHIDTAQAYGNEEFVGRGLSDSQLQRDEYFLTTKVWKDKYRDGDLQQSVEISLEKLGVDSVDLLLLHWPNDDVPMEETIAALNDAHKQGLTRHIGVSNFTTALLDKAVRISEAPILTNQIEYHPFIDQSAVIEAASALGTSITAYCPLAQGKVMHDPVIGEIAKGHDVSPVQVTMRWFVQQPGVICLPRSSKAEHIRTNNDIYDFALTPDEMAQITELNRQNMRLINPGWGPDWD